jgi:hypothetical protein
MSANDRLEVDEAPCGESLMVNYRLFADCHLDGRRYKRGDILERPHDWKGPMRPVRIETNKHGQPLGGTHEEQPLYERVDGKEP